MPPGPASSESEHVFPVGTHTHIYPVHIYMHTQPHGPTKTENIALIQSQTTPVTSSCSPLWLSRKKGTENYI